MVASNKSFGKSTLAGLFAAAAIASAVPAFASTTITWNFNNPTGALGQTVTSNYRGYKFVPDTSHSYTGTVTGSPLPSNVTGTPTITAYGYTMSAWDNTGTATGLYGKNGGTTEQGLGLAKGVDQEISIYSSGTQYFIQLDLTPFLTQSFFQSQSATLTIGSLQTPDTAELWLSNAAGVIGTHNLGTVDSTKGSNVTSSAIPLSDFSASDPYLTITAQVQKVSKDGRQQWCGSQYTTESVLLNSMTINIPGGNGGGASPAPIPATAGLTVVGAVGMGMMLLARRRRSAL